MSSVTQASAIIGSEADRGARVRSGVMMRVLLVFGALAVLSVAISVAGKWVGRSIAMAGHTDATTVYEIVIGDDRLAVPANMIRFENGRRDGAAARLDLYLRWPRMDGYSREASDDFNHIAGRRNILFLSFEQRMMSRDMSGRLEPIYRSLIEQPGRAGPAGLVVHSFVEKSGYVDEMLVVGGEESARPFVMRCLSGGPARESLAPCERDIHVGNGLSVTYRMPAELMRSWREVDEAVRSMAERLLRNGRAD